MSDPHKYSGWDLWAAFSFGRLFGGGNSSNNGGCASVIIVILVILCIIYALQNILAILALVLMVVFIALCVYIAGKLLNNRKKRPSRGIRGAVKLLVGYAAAFIYFMIIALIFDAMADFWEAVGPLLLGSGIIVAVVAAVMAGNSYKKQEENDTEECGEEQEDGAVRDPWEEDSNPEGNVLPEETGEGDICTVQAGKIFWCAACKRTRDRGSLFETEKEDGEHEKVYLCTHCGGVLEIFPTDTP